jgi:hypothetical protein
MICTYRSERDPISGYGAAEKSLVGLKTLQEQEAQGMETTKMGELA